MRLDVLILSGVLFGFFVNKVQAEIFSGNQVVLNGSAGLLSDGSLQLTDGGVWEASSAWLDNAISTESSFTVKFDFYIQGNADGISFALQNQGLQALGNSGGYIGYSGLNAVGSVIQTWSNNNLGINVDGDPYHTPHSDFGLSSTYGNEIINYDVINHVLSVAGIIYSLDNPYSNYLINDSANIDLYNRFGSSVFIGFTGGTGMAASVQKINNFSVVSAVPLPSSIWLFSSVFAGFSLFGRRKLI